MYSGGQLKEMRMGKRTMSEAVNQNYVWAIKSTFAVECREAVFFNTVNDSTPASADAFGQIKALARGEDFSDTILPSSGWFVESPPQVIPPMFVANDFFVINNEVKDALQRCGATGVRLHPFALYDEKGGTIIGEYHLLIIMSSDSLLLEDRSLPALRRRSANGKFVLRGSAKDDEVRLADGKARRNQVWIDRNVSDAVFFGCEVYRELTPLLEEAKFRWVRCVSED